MTTTPTESPDTNSSTAEVPVNSLPASGYAQPRSADLPAAPEKSAQGVGITSPAARRYLYGLAIALILAAQAFRLIPGDTVDTIVNVVTAVLGLGAPALAIPNTPAA